VFKPYRSNNPKQKHPTSIGGRGKFDGRKCSVPTIERANKDKGSREVQSVERKETKATKIRTKGTICDRIQSKVGPLTSTEKMLTATNRPARTLHFASLWGRGSSSQGVGGKKW